MLCPLSNTEGVTRGFEPLSAGHSRRPILWYATVDRQRVELCTTSLSGKSAQPVRSVISSKGRIRTSDTAVNSRSLCP